LTPPVLHIEMSLDFLPEMGAAPAPSAPRPPISRKNTNPDFDPYVMSQQHLLKPTADNPQPTAVPPPIAANAGTLGVRHVLSIIGLPGRGKPYIAKRLQAYLSFFMVRRCRSSTSWTT